MGTKIRYDWLKSHHICVSCGQQDAQKGHTLCLECRMKVNARAAEYRAGLSEEKKKKQLEHNRTYDTERRRSRKNAGLCPKCGKRKPEQNYVMCSYCLARTRRRYAERCRRKDRIPRSIRVEIGLCSNCYQPAIKGRKLCQSCYDKACRSLIKARASRNLEGLHQKISALFSTQNRRKRSDNL